MPQATFTPKYLNPPKGNARSASIKDADGGFWGCHPGDLSKFTAGVPVTVEYTTSENNGRTYYNIRSIVGRQTANPQAGRTQQAVQRVVGANSRRDPQQSEDIFVCGVVNHAIAHQSYPITADTLAQLVRFAREGWRNGEPDAQSQSEAPMPESEEDYYRA